MEQLRARWQEATERARRLLDDHAQVVDLFIAATVAGIGIGSSESSGGALGAALVGALLAVRRRYVFASYIAVFVIAAITGRADPWGTFLGILVAAATLATYARQRMLAFLVLLASVIAVTVEFGGDLSFIPQDVVPFLILGSIWIAGSAISRRQRRIDESEERARRRELEQEQMRQNALAEERARIARELHDVVTHSVSVMVVQAGAARRKLAHHPDASNQALLAVEATGREALHELRGFLGVLDGNGHTPLDLAPQPGLADLDALVQRVSDAGLPVEVSLRGENAPLPPAADLAAYRVVQEALTNALKYAERARTEVVLDYRDAGLALEVVDEGPGTVHNGADGRGLTGLAERVAVCGGTFSAGRRPSGGFAVRAWLPNVAAAP